MSDPATLTHIRTAALGALKASPEFVAIVPASQIHPMTAPSNPTTPFVKPGTPISTPIDAVCVRGDEIRWTLFARADARFNDSGAMVELGEDHMARLIAAAKSVLHNRRFAVPLGTAHFRYITTVMRQVDGEADAFEANIQFRVRAVLAR